MSWYGKRLPNFISGSTEERVRSELAKVSINIGEKLEIISIYPRGSLIYVWYFLDIDKAGRLPEQIEKIIKKKKTTKKKAK